MSFCERYNVLMPSKMCGYILKDSESQSKVQHENLTEAIQHCVDLLLKDDLVWLNVTFSLLHKNSLKMSLVKIGNQEYKG